MSGRQMKWRARSQGWRSCGPASQSGQLAEAIGTLFGRLGFVDGNADCQDALVVGGLDIVFVGTGRKRHRSTNDP